MEIRVIMQQKGKYRWQIVSPSGIVIKDDIMLNDALQAREYIKAYVSSYSGWDYEVQAQ